MKSLFPTVEHYIPRHIQKKTGEKKLVLACDWCDKAKGMLHGDEYLEIVREFMAFYPRFEVAQMHIKRKCKSLNFGRRLEYFKANPDIHESLPLTMELSPSMETV